MKYTCEGCKAEFEGSPEEAFDLGWDTPERFMSHCTCPECPITCTVWWKAVVVQDDLTDEEILLVQSYNQIYESANQQEAT